MKERPILFSGPMVRAILDGRKTQTRRVVKTLDHSREMLNCYSGAALFRCSPGIPRKEVRCPYGWTGDRLWVRETWRTVKKLDAKSPARIAEMAREAGYEPWGPVEYAVDQERINWEPFMPDEPGKTRVSLHMPRWASRITLDVTSVRVERLHEISAYDVVSEGIDLAEHSCGCEVCARSSSLCTGTQSSLMLSWISLWDSINGKRPGCSWDANPWVWVVSFKVSEKAKAA